MTHQGSVPSTVCLNLSEDASQINKSSAQHYKWEKKKNSVCALKVEWDHPRLLNQKYPHFRNQRHGWWLSLSSHAPARCLFQLHLGENGGGTLMGGLPHMVPHSVVCTLHLIAVVLSWGAHSSHSLCHFTAMILSSRRRLELLTEQYLHQNDTLHSPPTPPHIPILILLYQRML